MNADNATNNMYTRLFKLKKLISDCKNNKKYCFLHQYFVRKSSCSKLFCLNDFRTLLFRKKSHQIKVHSKLSLIFPHYGISLSKET